MSDKRQFHTYRVLNVPSTPLPPLPPAPPLPPSQQEPYQPLSLLQGETPDPISIAAPYSSPHQPATAGIASASAPLLDLNDNDSASDLLFSNPPVPALPSLKQKLARFVVPVLSLILVGAIAFTWLAPSSSSTPSSLSGITQQSFGSTPLNNTNSGVTSSTDLHVYVVGAVKHPGVYTLPAGARVYQLIQAAGGTLPGANLVALNMAAPLTDGQEVYVITTGEIPPTYLGGVPGPGSGGANGTVTPGGQLVNINTASADEMRQVLHVSSTTAQDIINYRTQNGPFTSVDQLLNVVSKSIYDKIRTQVTV